MSAVPSQRNRTTTVVVVAASDDRRADDVAAALEQGGCHPVMADPEQIDSADFEVAGVHAMVVVIADGDGPASIESARAVRRVTHVAVIAVTDGRFDEVLATGVDDVVATAAVPTELVARVEARSRRRSLAMPDRLEVGGLRIDRDERSVHIDDQPIELTGREFDLLSFLVGRAGQMVSRAELLREVWGSSPEWQQERTVNEHVRRLRNKIGDRWIATIRGYGYRFDADAERDPGREPD